MITGAGRGLGAAIAKALKDAPVRLVLCAKTQGSLEEVDDAVGGATLVALDFAKPAQIDMVAGGIAQRFGRLDGLISAHVAMQDLTPIADLEPKILSQMVTVNLLANQRLIRAFDPLLRAGNDPFACFMSCDAGRGSGKAFWGALAACKAGLEAMVDAYAAEASHAGIEVCHLDPGPMATRSRRRAYPGEPAAQCQDIDHAAKRVIEMIRAGRRDWLHV